MIALYIINVLTISRKKEKSGRLILDGRLFLSSRRDTPLHVARQLETSSDSRR